MRATELLFRSVLPLRKKSPLFVAHQKENPTEVALVTTAYNLTAYFLKQLVVDMAEH
jgi:hypothetical protein